jgi:hypothetical protein
MIEKLSLFVRMMRLKVVVTVWTFMLLGLARHTAHLTSPRLGAALLALGAAMPQRRRRTTSPMSRSTA